jgi:transcriptional regulator with XRE-family HTH domain
VNSFTATAEPPAHTPKSLRVRMGLSQAELAARTGGKVGTRAIRNIEQGHDCSLGSARALAAALRVPIQDFIAAVSAEATRRGVKAS